MSDAIPLRPLSPAGSVPLAVLERSGLIESQHLGAAVLVDPDGTVVEAHGDVEAHVYPRSTLKPFQATAALRSGLGLVGEQLVLATASHAGTERHQAVVRTILGGAGLDESALRCPPAWPGDRDARAAASAPSRLAMNCSGKHAAFLAACVREGWTLEDYLRPEHPLQERIRSVVAELTGAEPAHWGVDGCGAPVAAMGLLQLARGLAALERSGSPLPAAIREHPWAIDGEGRANTAVIERTGVVAKLGAEGVLVLLTPEGSAVAVKSLDGSHRATTIAGLGLLARNGLVDAEAAADAAAATVEAVTGGDEVVGGLRLAL